MTKPQIPLNELACYADYGLQFCNTKSGSIFTMTGLYKAVDTETIILTNGDNFKSLDVWPLKPLVRDLADYKELVGSDLGPMFIDISSFANGYKGISSLSYGAFSLLVENHYDVFGWLYNGLAERKGE